MREEKCQPDASRKLWFGLLVASHLVMTTSASSHVDDAELRHYTPLEQFKQFIATPPMIESAVYRTITANDPSKGLPASEGGCGPKDWVYYFFARWQQGCLFLKSGTNLDVSQPGSGFREEINSRFHDEYWRLDAAGVLTIWQDPAGTPADINMQPTRMFHTHSHQLKELLNMGIMQIEAGALKWAGNDFTANGYVPELKTPVRVRGKLIPTSNGYAKEMRVEYRSRAGVYNYVLRYLYPGESGLSFLPRTIQASFVSEAREIKLMECTLISIKTNSAALDRSAFDLRNYVPPDRTPTVLYTNETYYAKNLVGGWSAILDRSGHVAGPHQVRDRLNNNNLYYIVVVLSTIFAFSMVWRITKNKNAKSLNI